MTICVGVPNFGLAVIIVDVARFDFGVPIVGSRGWLMRPSFNSLTFLELPVVAITKTLASFEGFLWSSPPPECVNLLVIGAYRKGPWGLRSCSRHPRGTLTTPHGLLPPIAKRVLWNQRGFLWLVDHRFGCRCWHMGVNNSLWDSLYMGASVLDRPTRRCHVALRSPLCLPTA